MPHSQFAAKMGFPAGLLARISHQLPAAAGPLALLLVLSLGLYPAAADDLDDVLGAFDETPASLQSAAEESHAFDFGGRLELGLSYNFAHSRPEPGETDWRGLSRMRFDLGLETQYRFNSQWRLFVSGRAQWDAAYSLNGRDNYSPEVLDAYETLIEWTDTFVEGRIGRLELKIGRQIVAWGNSETLRITDVLNPLDLREPGLTDIEDLRLPVSMTRLDLPVGRVNLTAIAIHEIRFDRTAVIGHDFYSYAQPLPPEMVPSSSWSNTEFAFSATSTLGSSDLSFYLADVFDDQAHLERLSPFSFHFIHSRVQMLGASWDLAVNNTLLKAEIAHVEGLEFFARPNEEFSRTDFMAGLEYSGFAETSVTFEAVQRRIHGWHSDLALIPDLKDENRTDWVIRLSRFFLHQTLSVNFVGISFGIGADSGSIERLEARYDLNDTVNLTAGVVFYQSKNRIGIADYSDNDRIFLEIEYHFR